MAAKDILVIVPTIREYQCMRQYYANARKHGFDLSRTHTLLITEDFCDKAAMEKLLRDEGVSGEVFNHTDRLAWFKANGVEEYADLIPKRSHAETSFGLLYMAAQKQYKYGVFIDDDTLPIEGHDFFGGHMRNLHYEGETEIVASNKKWVNVLYQKFQRHGLYPRGYPYAAMKERVEARKGKAREIICSQGLWTNVPDLDAVRILMDGNLQGQAETRTHESDFTGNFVAAPGNYLTVCSMNLAFKREVIPAFYQLPMDDNPWKIGRFDDIWSGVFLKRAADVLGKDIVTGYPLCEHNKAPRSTFKDLNAEVPALELNEHLWEILETVQPREKTYAGLFRQFADAVEANEQKWAYHEYFPFMAKTMRRWVECVEKLEKRAA